MVGPARAGGTIAWGGRIGLAIGTDSIRAIRVRGGRVLWAFEAEIEPGESIARALGELLAAVPLGRWPRPSVIAAVGPSRAQVKRLSGLPPIGDARVLSSLVREGAGRLFLKNGVPLVTTDVLLSADGEVWAAAVEQPAVEDVRAACRAHRLRLEAVVPAIVSLPFALHGDHLAWTDGAVRVEATVTNGQLTSVRRSVGTAADSRMPDEAAVEPLASVGEGAARFADAYGAAVFPQKSPLAVRGSRTAKGADSVPRWRLGLCAVSLALAAAAALVSPGIAAMRANREAQARLSSLAVQRAEAAVAEAELSKVTRALGEVAAFDAARRSATLLLGDLTEALPDQSALIALRVDTAGGTLVVLAPRAATTLGRLERVSGMAAQQIVGPVTREVAGAREVERATIGFRWAAVGIGARSQDASR